LYSPPGPSAEIHLLVPIGTTGYPTQAETREEKRQRAIELRRILVGRLEGHGLVKAATRLAYCGRRVLPITKAGRIWRIQLGCGAAFCPVCVLRRGEMLFRAMRDSVAACVGSNGAAAHLTLAQPALPMSVLHRLDRLAKEVRSAKQNRIWREGFRHTLGVVMGVEVAEGSALDGFPHVHLFVFSHDPHEVRAFIAWMRQRWKRRVGWALVEGLQVIALSANPREWAPRLRYVMKGSELDPAWPEPLLRGVVASLSARKRLFSCWGLAMRKGGWLRPRPGTERNVVALKTVAASRLRATS